MDSNKDFDRLFDAAFSATAFVSNRHIIAPLMRLGCPWDMDLKSIIVRWLVSPLSVVPMLAQWNLGKQPLDAEGNFRGTPQGVKLSELAHISLLPRETVKRLLAPARNVQAALQNLPNNTVPTASAPDTGSPTPEKRAS